MKSLELADIYIDVDTKKPVTDWEKVKGSHQVLQLSWVCDTCKYKTVHYVPKRSAYSEADLVSVVNATFNMAHYQCGCK